MRWPAFFCLCGDLVCLTLFLAIHENFIRTVNTRLVALSKRDHF